MLGPYYEYNTGGTQTAKQYSHVDWQGSVIATSDASGNRVDLMSYDAFGNPSVGTGQPFKYTGRRWDDEVGLYYYRARYYHPTLGRFLQTDPVGYADNMNMYAYVGNDPVNATDPSGMASKQDHDSGKACEEDPFCTRTSNPIKGRETGDNTSNSNDDEAIEAVQEAKDYTITIVVHLDGPEDFIGHVFVIITNPNADIGDFAVGYWPHPDDPANSYKAFAFVPRKGAINNEASLAHEYYQRFKAWKVSGKDPKNPTGQFASRSFNATRKQYMSALRAVNNFDTSGYVALGKMCSTFAVSVVNKSTGKMLGEWRGNRYSGHNPSPKSLFYQLGGSFD